MRKTFLDEIPVRIGRAEEFASIAQTLNNSSYNEETICGTFKLTNMSEVGSIADADVERPDLPEQLRILLHLFLAPSLVARSEVERVFDRATIDAFLALGLIGTGEFGNDEFYARAFVYPVADFLIASDRHSLPDGSKFEAPPDIVFPAIFAGTLQFLQLLPTKWQGAALDLCSGSGIGALSLSRSGRTVVASDITQRAAVFARFNCALNEVENVEVACGDLYQAVDDRTFGCIVAHPPYVPSLETRKIWRDGGTTGDSLVRRIIEELPRYLEPGGIFFCICLGVDTEQRKFEERVRLWLGPNADEFDIIFACKEVRSPQQVLDNLARRYSEIEKKDLDTVRSEYEREGVLKMPLGALYLRRTSEPTNHRPWNVRKQLGAQTDGSDVEQVFEMHDRLLDPDFLKKLEEATPQLAPRLEVKVTHVVHERSLVPAEILFEVDKPFEARARFERWMVPLLSRLDGKTTSASIYNDAEAKGEIPEDFKLADFAKLLARTLELGFTVLS